MRTASFIAVLLACVIGAEAQEIDLPPIVVTGTFELRRTPSATDLFTQHFERQIESRRLIEEIMERSPWYYSRVWKYMVIPLGSSQNDSLQFFLPNYSSAEYRNTERVLQESQKQSLFQR